LLSGKTTLLKLISGQIFSGECSGHWYVNRKQADQAAFRRIISLQGYVPQQDIFLESLTVWQTLVYATLLRTRGNLSIEAKVRRAANVMVEMGLDSVARHSLSTQSDSKGISGGQRRRLSIAQAFLGDPQAILLDEPTSGLDASTSLSLLKILVNMKQVKKTTIVLTIHQPRAEVFDMFDNLILLSSGGYMIYSGPASGAVAVIAQANQIKVSMSNYENPGDFIMDVLGARSEDEDGINTQRASSTGLAGIFAPSQLSRKLINATKRAVGKVFDSSTHGGNDRLGDYEMVSMEESLSRESTSLPKQVEEDGITDSSQSTLDEREDHISTAIDESAPNAHDQRLLLIQELNQIYLKSDHFKVLKGKYLEPQALEIPNQSWMSSLCKLATSSSSIEHEGIVRRIIASTKQSPTSMITQLWVLFARRMDAQWPSPKQFLLFIGQMSLIGNVICHTFNYDVSTALELPYQVSFLPFLIA
jgi:ABC-type multidrug transport system ATPase subunit